MNNEKHQVRAEDAHKLADWLQNRGGILVWESADLRSAGRSVSTPAKTAEGADMGSPGWQFPRPQRHITDPADVEVYKTKIVREVIVKLQPCRGGMALEPTKGSSRRIRSAVDSESAQRGTTAWYVFKSTGTQVGSPMHGLMEGQDVCYICIEDGVEPLTDWLARNPLPATVSK